MLFYLQQFCLTHKDLIVSLCSIVTEPVGQINNGNALWCSEFSRSKRYVVLDMKAEAGLYINQSDRSRLIHAGSTTL